MLGLSFGTSMALKMAAYSSVVKVRVCERSADETHHADARLHQQRAPERHPSAPNAGVCACVPPAQVCGVHQWQPCAAR